MPQVSRCAVQPPKDKYAPLPILDLHREDGRAKRTDYPCPIMDSENEEKWVLTSLHSIQIVARTAKKNPTQAHQIMCEVQDCGLMAVMRMARAADCYRRAARTSGSQREKRTAATMQHRLGQVPWLPWNWAGWERSAAWRVQQVATQAAAFLRQKLGEICDDPIITSEVLKLNRVSCAAMYADFKRAAAARDAEKAAQARSGGQVNAVCVCPRPGPGAAAETGKSESGESAADGCMRAAGTGAKKDEEKKEGADMLQDNPVDSPQANSPRGGNPPGGNPPGGNPPDGNPPAQWRQESSPVRLSRFLVGAAMSTALFPFRVVKKGISALAPKRRDSGEVHQMLLPSQEEDRALVWSQELGRYLMGDETPEDIEAMRQEMELRNGPPPPPPVVQQQQQAPPPAAGGLQNLYVMPVAIFGGNAGAGPAAPAGN